MPFDLDDRDGTTISTPEASHGGSRGAARRAPRLTVDQGLELLGADSRRLLTAAREDTVSPRWEAPTFARQVDAVRRQLEPIHDPVLLAESLLREAFLGPRVGRVPAVWASPVRVGYAVRWIELQAGLELPAWRHWFG